MKSKTQVTKDATRIWLAAVLLALLLSVSRAAAQQQPAVLVVSPLGAGGGWVDLDYLSELRAAGFQVDYTDSMADFTWDRIKQYNVLVVFTCPPPPGINAGSFTGTQQLDQDDFIALVERFLQQGGGVFVMATETQIRITLLRNLLTRWGADLPLERIADPDHHGVMSRMPTVSLTYTSAVAPSAVSDGVHGLWYPTDPYYNSAFTAPLSVDGHWQVVVQGMPSSRTVPVDLSTATTPLPPNPLIRPGGVSAPPLVAIRPYGAGRLALMSQLPAFSIGSGTKWLYDSEVLSTGVSGMPSDLSTLLENSFRWLAEPSLQSKAVGGYVTPASRLLPPNREPGAVNAYPEIAPHPDDPSSLDPPADTSLFKGVIGVQTSLTGGSGTVADYAAAARRAGLDFLVFLEDFTQLDAGKLSQLAAACRQSSDGHLTLYPGYRLDNNIGNHMFLFGTGAVMPPAQVLTPPARETFMLQGETAPGIFGLTPTYPIDFILGLTGNTQIGYYDFSHSGLGMRVSDARLYGMAAVRTYRGGTLIDDATADFLTTAQATSVPAPIAVNLIHDPATLVAAAAAGQGLTYAQARSRDHLWDDALRYGSQYDCLNVFPSSGPLILRWPGCGRLTTLGAEPFVTGRSRMDSPLYVTAPQGLRDIRIYDGGRLFRRFVLNGQRAFSTVLHLEASVQRNLVVIAEDRVGGQAISAARRSWKDGSLTPVFCSDRINDCGNVFLAHGPYPMTVLRTPEVPDSGVTWDGGPRGILTPIMFEGSNPLLQSDQGTAVGDQYNQTPLLDFGDEGAVAVRSVRDQLIDPRVVALDPWRTYGPRAASHLMSFSLSYVQWDRASVAVPPTGWSGPPQQTGCNAAIFRGTVDFTQPLNVTSLRVLRNWHWIPSLPMHVVAGNGATVSTDFDVASVGAGSQSVRINPGDWFGFYSPQTANSQLFINRGGPLDLRVTQPPDSTWLSLWAVTDGTAEGSGRSYGYELFSVGCPLDAAVHDAKAMSQQVAYLASPERLQVTRGRRAATAGAFETQLDRYAVHIVVPPPSAVRNLTIPVVVQGLNPRWSAGLWQLHGFVKGDYGSGNDRYRSIGIDPDGNAYVPLYPDLAPRTEVEIGHPVSADTRGSSLFIQVTALSGGTDGAPVYEWVVEANNPTDQPITSTLMQRMALPNLAFGTQTVTLAAGEQRVVYRSALAPAPPTPSAIELVRTALTPSPRPSRTATRVSTSQPTRTWTRPPAPTPPAYSRTATPARPSLRSESFSVSTSIPTPTPLPTAR
jgi:hypothetical protein